MDWVPIDRLTIVLVLRGYVKTCGQFAVTVFMRLDGNPYSRLLIRVLYPSKGQRIDFFLFTGIDKTLLFTEKSATKFFLPQI